MGFNTVAFVLNDHMHELVKSPHTVSWALCHPPMSDHPSDMESWKQQIMSVARDHDERMVHLSQDLVVLPTFHADNRKFFVAGRNDITELSVVRFNKNKGKKTVTLELPDWWPE